MNFDYDEKQTKSNAKALLSRASHIRAIIESQSYVRSPVMSHAPASRSNINPETVAKMAIKTAEAKEEWEAINEAVKLLDDESQFILSRKYLVRNPDTNTGIYLDMSLSSSSFYRKLDITMLEFAFCYRGGELIAWK